jgi:hypothetical protein
MAVHWWPTPTAGDIVWCRFPQGRLPEPGPKPCPALVVKVFDDRAPQYFVLVAYGTSHKTNQLRSGEFLISNTEPAAYRLAGLSYPTRFSFRNLVELPFDDQWFKPPPAAPHGQTPRLGVLHPSLMRRVQAAWEAVAG